MLIDKLGSSLHRSGQRPSRAASRLGEILLEIEPQISPRLFRRFIRESVVLSFINQYRDCGARGTINLLKAGFFLDGDAVSGSFFWSQSSTLLVSGALRDRVEEKAKRFAMDFLFDMGLGLPFSSVVIFAFREGFSRRVSRKRDFLRAGDDDPSIGFRGEAGDDSKLPASCSSIVTCEGPLREPLGGVRGRYPNSAAIVAA